MSSPDVSIIIACYNEEPHLRQSVAEVIATMKPSGYTYELIFVEDASQDRTAELIREICDSEANCRFLQHTQNVGRGGTVADGLRMARGRIAGFLDIDLEIHPRYIPSLVSSIESGQYAVATIARTYHLSWHPYALLRTILSVGYRRIVNLALALPFIDTETGYKFFNREKIMPVIENCRNKGWFWDTEVMALSHENGLDVLELSGLFERRPDKKSTVRIFRDMFIYARNLMEFRKRMRAREAYCQDSFLARSISRVRGKVAQLVKAEPKARLRTLVSSIVEKFPTSILFEKIREQLSSLGAKVAQSFERHFMALAVLSILSVTIFIIYHVLIISFYKYSQVEKVMALGLLGCEIFFAVNGIGYAFWINNARNYRSGYDQYLAKESASSVACLMPVCDEPADVIRETLASVCAMRYKNKKVYVLDDSTKKENKRKVADLADAYGATLIKRKDRKHYKAGNINNALKKIRADYIAVFDADQRPSLDFLRDLVPLLDKNPKLALVQTPQDYENSHSLIAHAAALQNALFYEYISESKDANASMFCCGTNFVMRCAALAEVGGFDTSTLTEDFATTLKLHARGWHTRFHDKLYVMGVGPETLGEYLKQYSRWATGTLQVLKMAVKILVTNPRALTVKQWFEYWLSCSYYLSGVVNFYLLLLPAAYMFFGVNLIRGHPFVYLALFFVVFMSFWSFFLYTSIKRGYSAGQLIVVCARLETCKFYIYSKALVSALLGWKPAFKVTDKGGSRQLPWSYLAVPLVVFSLNVASALIGLYRLGVVFHPYLAINTLWSIYNVWQLSAIIQYNTGSKSLVVKHFNLFKVGQTEAPATVSTDESGAA